MSRLPTANKDLGQHFLRSEKVIKAITTDHANDCDIIIEVGPGPAILTKDLSTKEKPLYVLEKDPRFKSTLEKIVIHEQIFMGDALKFNWDEFIETHQLQNKKIWLVSNLPYNVGTILYTQFLQIKEIHYMTLMFQKEVGDKTYPRIGKNQMNGLLFLSTNYFNAKQLIKVSPGCFDPPPKVESVVVSYIRIDEPQIGIQKYNALNKFTRHLFSQKRKQIGSVLKSYYSKEDLESFFEKSNFPRTMRAEALSHEEVFQLFTHLHQ